MSRHSFEVVLENDTDQMFPDEVASQCERVALDAVADSGLLPDGCQVVYPERLADRR
jgi:hypothetical protein